MRGRIGGAFLIILAVSAGCLNAAAPAAKAPTAQVVLQLTAEAPEARTSGECRPMCPQVVLEYGPASESPTRLTLEVRWDGRATPGFHPWHALANGSRLTAAVGFDAARVRINASVPGTYAFELNGTGAYELVARAGGVQAGPDGLLRPNLVTLVPREVGVAACTRTEAAEQGAQRCLRLGNGVGNVGLGPLEVRLGLADGAQSVLGQGSFVQRIYSARGDPTETRVGGARFHLTHTHFHYAGLAGFQLHVFDPATGLRGEPVTAMKKSGFCFIDVGPMDQDEVPRGSGDYSFLGCFAPDPTHWEMGVSPGWFDYYASGLDEQYVEISGVPDGVYELVSVADQAQTLVESDEEDNAASVVLRLTGDDVEILERRGYWKLAADG